MFIKRGNVSAKVFMHSLFLLLLTSSVFVLALGWPRTAEAITHLDNCDEANLRTAIAQGGMVSFDCDATIALTSTIAITNQVTLDANGHTVELSGGNAVRL